MIDHCCTYPSCAQPGCRLINGRPYCGEHHVLVMQEAASDYLSALSPGSITRPKDNAQLRFLLRWIGEVAGWPAGLTRAKVRDRSMDWMFDGRNLTFSVERHPAGLTVAQRWAIDVYRREWEVLSESVIDAPDGLTKKGAPKCPQCGCSMTSRPGRLSCNNTFCRRKILHEHSLSGRAWSS
jgi:hypothetical protein